MPRPRHRHYEPRKEPRQDRSRQMRARILDAAIRVLRDEGALGFTTTRVADEAEISVGSLYQYFPNKHALAVAMHRQAVEGGWQHVQTILDRDDWTPRRKVTELARWYFATESTEVAELGAVFDDVEVFLSDEADTDLDASVHDRFTRFIAQATGRSRAATVRFDAQLLITTLESVGKAVARRGMNTRERNRWATATATMLSDHLGLNDA